MAKKARKTSATKHHPWIVRFLHFHIRLVVAIVLAVAVYALLPGDWPRVTRALVGWDTGIVIYLAAVIVMMTRASEHGLQERSATQEDEGAIAILLLTITTAGACLAAIFLELAQAESSGASYGYHVALAVSTVLLSWAFTHTIFALHYAFDYYGDGQRTKGLKFPDDDRPDYWDFIYFSFVIGMTFQVSDVQVTNKGIRRLVAAHGVMSFLFNTTVIALMVNLATDAF
jgi:uncharacterized membrane protein